MGEVVGDTLYANFLSLSVKSSLLKMHSPFCLLVCLSDCLSVCLTVCLNYLVIMHWGGYNVISDLNSYYLLKWKILSL